MSTTVASGASRCPVVKWLAQQPRTEEVSGSNPGDGNLFIAA